MTALAIDDEFRRKCVELREYAEEHPFGNLLLKDISNMLEPPVHDRPEYRIYLPASFAWFLPSWVKSSSGGYRVVFAKDELGQYGWGYRLWITVNARGKLPHPTAVDAIAKEFGFGEGLDYLDMVAIEEDRLQPDHSTVMLLQFCEGTSALGARQRHRIPSRETVDTLRRAILGDRADG